jgi:hypothetical protein
MELTPEERQRIYAEEKARLRLFFAFFSDMGANFTVEPGDFS